MDIEQSNLLTLTETHFYYIQDPVATREALRKAGLQIVFPLDPRTPMEIKQLKAVNSALRSKLRGIKP